MPDFGGGSRVSAQGENYRGAAGEDAILTTVPVAPLSLASSLNAPPGGSAGGALWGNECHGVRHT